MVDHDVLLTKLQRMFAVKWSALNSLKSYLTNRSYKVFYASSTSYRVILICSVPQGSVLGPLLFVMYTAALQDLAKKRDISTHAFAYDSQL
jgi:Reverse transcriptase (RNA-dependent DNA polymerase)